MPRRREPPANLETLSPQTRYYWRNRDSVNRKRKVDRIAEGERGKKRRSRGWRRWYNGPTLAARRRREHDDERMVDYRARKKRDSEVATRADRVMTGAHA